jgi:hypothetical protein
MKIRAEVDGWSLLSREDGLPGLHTDENTISNGFAEADQIIHHIQWQHRAGRIIHHVQCEHRVRVKSAEASIACCLLDRDEGNQPSDRMTHDGVTSFMVRIREEREHIISLCLLSL